MRKSLSLQKSSKILKNREVRQCSRVQNKPVPTSDLSSLFQAYDVLPVDPKRAATPEGKLLQRSWPTGDRSPARRRLGDHTARATSPKVKLGWIAGPPTSSVVWREASFGLLPRRRDGLRGRSFPDGSEEAASSILSSVNNTKNERTSLGCSPRAPSFMKLLVSARI